MPPKNCMVLDAAGRYVSPGFIDIHLHGGGGYDFMDCTEEAFSAIAKTHLRSGATTIVPTAVSSDIPKLLRLMETYRKAEKSCPNLCGLHLEGPYLSVEQKGAHKPKYLHTPNDEETDLLLQAGYGILRRITAAPELDNMKSFTKRMLQNNISMSIGHSDATSRMALEAFSWGFSHVTHLYSATPSVRKINQVVEAGVVEAAYLDDTVTVELIADGHHAAIDALRLAVKIKGPEKVALVSDALRPAGTDATESWLGEKVPENRVIVEDGVAKLPDRSSFAGSIATAGTLLKAGCEHYGLGLIETVQMLTETPARILGLKNKGRLCAGCAADLVFFDDTFQVSQVILGGQPVE